MLALACNTHSRDMSCDPNELAELAKCFACLNPKQADAVRNYLLCQINENGGGGGGGGVTSFNSRTGAVVPTSGDYDTSMVTEAINLYYTDGRARLAISADAPLGYDNLSGILSIPAASGSGDGYLSSTDWTTFNSKQRALTQGAVGTTTGAIALDLNSYTFQTVSLTGNPTFSTTNKAAGRFLSLKIDSNGSSRNLAFTAGWVWLGVDYSAGVTLASGKIGVLSLTCYGTNSTDIVAVFTAQP